MPKDDAQQQVSVPPVIITEDSPPPAPQIGDQTDNQDILNPSPAVQNSSSSAPVNDIVSGTIAPSVITTSPKKKFAGGRVIATILGLFLLIGGVGAGVYLTGQDQNIAEKAGDTTCYTNANNVAVCTEYPIGDYTCDPNTGRCKCDAVQTDPSNSTCTPGQEFRVVGIGECSNPNLNIPCPPGTTKTNVVLSRECYRITPNCGPGSAQSLGECCKYDDEGQCSGYWITTYQCAVPIASCQNVKAYSETWVQLTENQLSTLKTNDKVNFCVVGATNNGSFDKAKFTINGNVRPETTTKRPSSDDFCDLYTILASDPDTFNVTAQIHHVTLGWK